MPFSPLPSAAKAFFPRVSAFAVAGPGGTGAFRPMDSPAGPAAPPRFGGPRLVAGAGGVVPDGAGFSVGRAHTLGSDLRLVPGLRRRFGLCLPALRRSRNPFSIGPVPDRGKASVGGKPGGRRPDRVS